MSGMGELFSFGLTRAIFFAMCGTEQSVGAGIGNIRLLNNLPGQLEPSTLLVSFDLSDLRSVTMLYTIAVVLLILWLLGLVTSYTLGGFIHILLVVAIVVILLRVISGRKPL